MKKLKIYLDTSVINFVFAEDAPSFQQVTIDFFRNRAPAYDLYISDVVVMEINKISDQDHRDRLLSVIEEKKIKILPTEDYAEIEDLADYYLGQSLLPKNKFEDALHVAYATIYEMDLLLSWNFRHLANINKEEKILVANREKGYRYPLRITSPLEVSNEP